MSLHTFHLTPTLLLQKPQAKFFSFSALSNPSHNPNSLSQLFSPIHSSRSSAISPLLLHNDDSSFSSGVGCTKWTVSMREPSVLSRTEVVGYYVQTLAKVLGSEKEAQCCIYKASWQQRFYFCCEIDEDLAQELARKPGVLSVKPDKKDEYTISNSSDNVKFYKLIDMNQYWLVQMEKPGLEILSKAQMVDYYVKTLAKILGNEKDAQVSIYHISWEKFFGFCCQIDEQYARELADLREVSYVRPDMNFGSDNKDYRGGKSSVEILEENQVPDIKTKRLFITGLSFYTSEKTLRAAFEGFGELVEVKVIMDKISKRSKGYAFIEYTTEEAAASALKEMNGKIINGWMIIVDVAKANPYSRVH